MHKTTSIVDRYRDRVELSPKRPAMSLISGPCWMLQLTEQSRVRRITVQRLTARHRHPGTKRKGHSSKFKRPRRAHILQ